MSEWQPIETVPKGIYVILGFFYEDVDFSDYQLDENADCMIQLGMVSHYDGYWVTCGAPSNHNSRIWLDVKPTHWMPLPEPPKDE